MASLAGAAFGSRRWWVPAAGADAPARWSDPATWGGAVPGPADVAAVDRPVLLDVDAAVAGVTIAAAGALIFDPDFSRVLTSSGNVVVNGELVMQPAAATVDHRLEFVGIDESLFVGGGMDPQPTDVGLWVIDAGVLRIEGAPRTPWARAVTALAQGESTIEVDRDLAGWRIGDEVVVVPTLPTTHRRFFDAYDRATVASVDGRTFTLSSPLSFDHPLVDLGESTLGAEVLNLTRNVRIEGKPSGRSHVFMRSASAQTIRFSGLRHMGPRQPSGRKTAGVAGRYGLHFHHCGDGSRGSVVDGVVVRDTGGHAFVPHVSHGVTFTGCIAHETFEDAYWWDPPGPSRERTNDTLWEECIASRTSTPKRAQGWYRLSGFSHGLGDNNVATGCVAVGVYAGNQASGFGWPPKPRGVEGVWEFVDCVAHNNRRDGVFVWQNGQVVHPIERLRTYHNGYAGIDHGAYINRYQFLDCVSVGNGFAGAVVHAVGRDDDLRYERNLIDGAGVSAYGFYAAKSPNEGEPAWIVDCTVTAVGATLGVAEGAGTLEERFHVVDTA